MKLNIRSLAALAMICFLMLFAGCGAGGSSSDGGSGGTGTLALSLTDAPADFQAVYVTIERVEVHLGGNEANPNNWQVINPPESGLTCFVKKTYNLLELTNGVLEELGMTELPAGFYTQMRLFIGEEPDDAPNMFGDHHESANYVIESGTTEQKPMKVPSGTQTGIKLVTGFRVGKNQLTELILDFDAEKSVHKAGNSGKYILQPTIKVLGTEVLGYYIKGTVFDEYGMGLGGASVSAQRSYPPAQDLDPKEEVFVENRTSSDEYGNFRLLVSPGIYNVVAYKDTYNFDYRCGVDAVADVESGVTTELSLADLIPGSESGVTEYGYVGGYLTVTGGGNVTISFRAPECERIELKSITVENVGKDPVPYKEMLPVAEGPYNEVVAWSGVTTYVGSGFTVSSEATTDLNFDF